MCGRFYLLSPPAEVRAVFRYDETPNFPARFNIAPTQPIAIVTAGRHFTLMRWGFIPGWVKDLARISVLINARVEGIGQKASFKNAIRRRRCLVPANGYYEWRRAGRGKVPFKIGLPDDELFGFAAIHETWMGPGGEELDTCAILTMEAEGPLRSIHDRIPLVLKAGNHDEWLAGGETNAQEALALALCGAVRDLEAVAISSAVNKVGNEGPALHEPDPEFMRPKDLFG